jgi:uncharacterized membrane protein
MNFFTKYKLHINIVTLLFWCIILYLEYSTGNFKLTKIAAPIVFILLSLFNIYNVLKANKSKSGN